MQFNRWSRKQRESIVWDWDCVKDFPGILCKQLLWPDSDYYVGWATFDNPEEFLTLQIRDQNPSRCLTPAGSSHGLGDVLQRMEENHWTFEGLAGGELTQSEAPRCRDWFKKCVGLEAEFDIKKMGFIAIHPRFGFKDLAVKDGIYDVPVHEVYEGLHRALILAKKLRERSVEWGPVKTIYLFPNRETERVS